MKINIPKYQYAEYLVDMVIKKISPACILESEGGLGKSYLVQSMVEEQIPEEYEYHSGHITPLALYKKMYDQNGKVIILDDVEEVFSNNISVGIMSPTLWKAKKTRIVSWGTTSDKLGNYPQKFEFKGGVILLANRIPRKNDPKVRAIITRTHYYRIELTYKEKMDIIKRILDTEDFYQLAGVSLSKDDRERLKFDLENNTSLVTKYFNFRTMVKMAMYYSYGKEYHSNQKDLHIRLHNATTEIDEDKELILSLIKKKLSVPQQVSQFSLITGKSRASYFRVKKKLKEEMK